MPRPTLNQFITENQYTLEQLYKHVLELNNSISFEDFCAFVYQYSH